MIYYIVLLSCYGSSVEVFRTESLDHAQLYAEQLSGDSQCFVTIKRKKQ